MNGKGTLLLCSAENGDLNGLIHALENGDDVETRDAVSSFFQLVFYIEELLYDVFHIVLEALSDHIFC